MSLKAICPECKASYAMKDRSKEGKTLKCKKCGAKFTAVLKESSGKSKSSRNTPAPVKGLPPKVRGKDAVYRADLENQPPPQIEGGGTSKPLMIAGVVAFIAMWAGIIYTVSQMDFEAGEQVVEKVDLPMKRGESAQGTIGVDYPTEWEFETGGGTGGVAEWIKINGDDVSVSIRTNLKASAMGDITSAGGTIQDEEVPEELEPIAGVHEFMKNDMLTQMDPYDEEAPEKVEAKAGNSRISKFVGDRGLLNGGNAYGYRATVPAGNDKLKVVCMCESQGDFEKYEPLLRKLILSIGSP